MFAASAFSGVFFIIAVGERQRGRLFYSACFLKRGENGPFQRAMERAEELSEGSVGHPVLPNTQPKTWSRAHGKLLSMAWGRDIPT